MATLTAALTGLTYSNSGYTQTTTAWIYRNQVQTNVTASRAFGTLYTNSLAYPIEVRVIVNQTAIAASASLVQCIVNSTQYVVQSEFYGSSGLANETVTFHVPPSSTYKVSVFGTQGNPTLIVWWELR